MPINLSDFDDEMMQYYNYVRLLWIPSTFPPTYTLDLISPMMDAGFVVDTVTSSDSMSAEHIIWYGRCCDENMLTYKFKAKWDFSMELFCKSVPHCYELTELDIEPEQ